MLANQPSQLDLALHSSSILITANEGLLSHQSRCSACHRNLVGSLVAWDLTAGSERLRTIPLTSEDVAIELAESSCVSTASHLILHGNRVTCDFGRNVKSVVMPFPHRRPKTT